MRARSILVCTVIVLIGGFLTIGFAGFTRHAVCRESVEKIRVGMTLKEVEELLHVPPGDYCSVPDQSTKVAIVFPNSREERRYWYVDHGAIEVFLEDGKVYFVQWFPVVRNSSLWDKIRYRMKL